MKIVANGIKSLLVLNGIPSEKIHVYGDNDNVSVECFNENGRLCFVLDKKIKLSSWFMVFKEPYGRLSNSGWLKFDRRTIIDITKCYLTNIDKFEDECMKG